MIKVVGEHDIQVFGMERSGHHGVINWILGHYSNYIHFNNCDIFVTPRLTVDCSNIFREGDPPQKRLVSIEDNPLWIPDWQRENLLIRLGELPMPAIRVLVIRCPYNLYASRWQAFRTMGQRFNEDQWELYSSTQIWKYYAAEFCGLTNHLRCDVKICFDRWFSDREYRFGLSGVFGSFTDNGLQKVDSFGCGSSFDGTRYDGAAQKMNVLRRYLNYLSDEEYVRKVVRDEEVRELAARIFGEFSLTSS
jgi:hypothetical protein